MIHKLAGIVLAAIALAAIAGIAWSFEHPGLTHMVVGVISIVLLLSAAVAFFAIRWPSGEVPRDSLPTVFDDPVLGPLRFADGQWSSESGRLPEFWLRGDGTGPDPELVRAGANAMTRLAELEPSARAYAAAELPSERPRTLLGVSAEWARRGGTRERG